MSEKQGASCGSGGPAPYTCRPRKQMASCLCSPVPLSLGLKGEDVRHPPDAGRGPAGCAGSWVRVGDPAPPLTGGTCSALGGPGGCAGARGHVGYSPQDLQTAGASHFPPGGPPPPTASRSWMILPLDRRRPMGFRPSEIRRGMLGAYSAGSCPATHFPFSSRRQGGFTAGHVGLWPALHKVVTAACSTHASLGEMKVSFRRPYP